MLDTSGFATLYTKLTYDPVPDLTPITVLVTQSYGVVVPNSMPVKTVKDMIALAKAKPRGLTLVRWWVG
jgi:tripartite-type tricarboxylate transporter receptor subunit TctC